MATECQTGVGRIVWGHPGKPQKKIHQDGPNKGQPVLKDGNPVLIWVMGVAFPRQEFETLVWPKMSAEAGSGYPQGIPPRFSWKYKDGDNERDSKGLPYSQREGYAGHIVLTISTELAAPPVYKWDGRQYIQLTPDQYKTGDYIACSLNFVVNVATGTNTPSLYVNPLGILHVGYGQEIFNGPDATQMFGAQPQQYALPAGASATPVAPAGAVGMPQASQMPVAPMGGGMPQQQSAQAMPGQPQPGMAPAPQQMPGMMPQQPAPGGMPGQPQYQPNHQFVQNAGYQQPGQPQQMPGMMPNQNPGMMPGNR